MAWQPRGRQMAERRGVEPHSRFRDNPRSRRAWTPRPRAFQRNVDLQIDRVDGAVGGSRTPTDRTVPQLLKRVCLLFHHDGKGLTEWKGDKWQAKGCPGPDSNRHAHRRTRVFEAVASAVPPPGHEDPNAGRVAVLGQQAQNDEAPSVSGGGYAGSACGREPTVAPPRGKADCEGPEVAATRATTIGPKRPAGGSWTWMTAT